MMNVAMLDNKRGTWLMVEGVIKIEKLYSAWILYFEDGETQEYKDKRYDLVSVDTY